MVPFSQLPAVKKDTIFGAVRKFFCPSYFVTALKPLQNKKGQIFLAAPKMVSFITEKDTIFSAARTFFGPSYFVTALVRNQTLNSENAAMCTRLLDICS